LDLPGDADELRALAAGDVDPERSDAAGDHQAHVRVGLSERRQGGEHRLLELVTRWWLEVDRAGARLEAMQMEQPVHHASARATDALEHPVAVEQAVIEHADLGVLGVADSSIDPHLHRITSSMVWVKARADEVNVRTMRSSSPCSLDDMYVADSTPPIQP